ncbi:MAG: hypothetical protein F6K26_39545 [Moorea sp. SIO2I5]|nr:hypothetical protein [Moorena sp. SIO2I5]
MQQMEGRVRPTMEVNGVGVNGDRGLESEADVMGKKAEQKQSTTKKPPCKERGKPEKNDDKVSTTPKKNIFPHHSQAIIAKTEINTDLHESKRTSEIQRAEADKPTKVRVVKDEANYDGINFVLKVRNERYIGDNKIGFFKKFGDGGEVSEIVEYHQGTGLKSQSQNSTWHKQGTSKDNHSIPRNNLATGPSGNQQYNPGKSIAEQMFIYKDNTLTTPTAIKKSGFEIKYTHKVFDGNTWHEDGPKIPATQGVYSELTIEKGPAKHNITGYGEYEAGEGEKASHTWLINQPTTQNPLVWQVTDKP